MMCHSIIKSMCMTSEDVLIKIYQSRWINSNTACRRKIFSHPNLSVRQFAAVTQPVNINSTKYNCDPSYMQNLCSVKYQQRWASSSGNQKETHGQSKLKLYSGAIIFGIVAGSTYAYWKEWSKHNKLFSDQHGLKQIGNTSADSTVNTIKDQYLLKDRPPSFTPSRSIRTTADSTGLKLTLFQFQTCPFCCKARAFLDYFGFNYDVIEVNSVMRTQVKWTSYKKVPILLVETPAGEVIQLIDSTMIISSLYSHIFDKSKGLLETVACYPRISSLDVDGKEKEEISNKYFLMFNEADTGRKKEDITQERKWRKWVDDTFVHTLSPNVYRSPSESLQAFRWFNETGQWEKHFSAWERFVVIYLGSAAMWIISKRLKKRHGLKPDVRQSLYDETNVWLKAIKARGGKFLGDDKPNLADLAVYGALSAIEGCDAFNDLCANTKVKPWYDNVKKAVENSEGQAILSKM